MTTVYELGEGGLHWSRGKNRGVPACTLYYLFGHCLCVGSKDLSVKSPGQAVGSVLDEGATGDMYVRLRTEVEEVGGRATSITIGTRRALLLIPPMPQIVGALRLASETDDTIVLRQLQFPIWLDGVQQSFELSELVITNARPYLNPIRTEKLSATAPTSIPLESQPAT